MALTIKEADWKVLRRLHPLALERFCERVLAEIESIRHGNARSFHQRYLDIFQIIKRRDQEMGCIFDDPKRSDALTMLVQMCSNGLLTENEFSSLSAETRNTIGLLMGTERSPNKPCCEVVQASAEDIFSCSGTTSETGIAPAEQGRGGKGEK